MRWKCVMFFSGQSQGWSETIYHQDSQASAAAVGGPVEALIQKRVAFLGNPFVCSAYRISAYSTNDGAKPSKPAHYFLRKEFASPPSFAVGDAEPGNVGIAAVVSDVANATSTRVVCGGPPDANVLAGGKVDWVPAGVGSKFDDYLNFLSNAGVPNYNWGWAPVGDSINIDLKDAALNTNTDGYLTITPLVVPGGILSGVWYPARISGVGKGKSSANGQLLMTPDATRTGLVSKEIIAIVPVVGTGGQVRLYPPVRGYMQFGASAKLGYTVKHRRGRPLALSRGRRPARPRG